MRALVEKLRHILVGSSAGDGFAPGNLDRELERIGFAPDGTITPMDILAHDLHNGELRTYRVASALLSSLPPDEYSVTRREMVERAAYTWINRLLALRAMEVRQLIDSTLRGDEAYGGLSEKLYFLRQDEPDRTSTADGGWWAVLEDACREQAKALPGLFALSDPIAALRPSPATLVQCIELVNGTQPVLPDVKPDELDAMFADPDAIGWAYQFYQEEAKASIDAKCKSGGKVTNRAELAAKTQLFTEPYMVRWLLQNSLGRSYHEAYPQSSLPTTWDYYVKPEQLDTITNFGLAQLTFLDPCMGSGHFLRVAFDMFVAMYREQHPDLSAKEIVDRILSQHLHGIDLDPRAAQLTALTLYLRAWELVRDEEYKVRGRRSRPCIYIPSTMNLATTPAGLTKGTLERHLQRVPEDRIFKVLLENIFTGLEHADVLGSLLRPREYLDSAVEELLKPQNLELEFDWSTTERLREIQKIAAENPAQLRDSLLDTIANSFKVEAGITDDVSIALFGREAEQGVRLLQLLDRQYAVVVTNPPYLGNKYMDKLVKRYVDRYYPSGRRDLYATFILRCLELCLPHGRVAMVTMHSWMFLRRFVELRAISSEGLVEEQNKGTFPGLLRATSIELLAHLGPNAFEEIDGEVVQSAIFTITNSPPSKNHRIVAFRLVGLKNTREKANALLGKYDPIKARQFIFTAIPETPFCYWLKETWLNLLSSKKRLDDVALVREGLHTTNNLRFLRCFWECPTRIGRWVPYVKGGGYAKWAGLEWLCVDWQYDGKRIRSTDSPVIPSYDLYFQPGFTYTDLAGGALGARFFPEGRIFDAQGPVIAARSGSAEGLACLVNSRPVTFMLRAISPTLHFRTGYVKLIPLPSVYQSLQGLGMFCVAIATIEHQYALTESLFLKENLSNTERSNKDSFLELLQSIKAINAIRLLAEAVIETKAYELYGLGFQEIKDSCLELGTPAGWYPLIAGYDTLPASPNSYQPSPPQELFDYLATHKRIMLDETKFARVKAKLKTLYEAGPGAKETELERAPAGNDDEEEIASGAHISIPTETFLEELSVKMELHPISIYWLLEELRAEEVRCRPEEKRLLEDRLSVQVLHLLGYRWPRQLDADESIPAWADAYGIIPLVSGTGKPTLADRVRERLHYENGALAVQHTEALLQELTGQNLEQWLRRSFFSHHIRQFEYRPVAWHLASTPTRESKTASNKSTKKKRTAGGISRGPAFECFLYYHACSKGALARIRTQYVEPLLNAERSKIERHDEAAGNPTSKTETLFQVHDEDDIEVAIAKERIRELEDFKIGRAHV